MLNYQQVNLFGRVQTSQTGFQLYRGTSPYGECYLGRSVVVVLVGHRLAVV